MGVAVVLNHPLTRSQQNLHQRQLPYSLAERQSHSFTLHSKGSHNALFWHKEGSSEAFSFLLYKDKLLSQRRSLPKRFEICIPAYFMKKLMFTSYL